MRCAELRSSCARARSRRASCTLRAVECVQHAEGFFGRADEQRRRVARPVAGPGAAWRRSGSAPRAWWLAIPARVAVGQRDVGRGAASSASPWCGRGGLRLSRIRRAGCAALRRRRAPRAASPYSGARPSSTALAPSARALAMSLPRRTPPSTSTSSRPPTAASTAGSIASPLGAASSWRPPWLESTMPSTP